MNILRLSLFNLKKNRKEAAAIAFLTMVTTLMLAVFMANMTKMNKGFDESFAVSGSLDFCMAIKDDKYRDEYREILESTAGVHDVVEDELLAAVNKEVEKDGGILSYSLIFVTEKTERGAEDFVKRDKLSDEKIAELAHPIWLPVYFQLSEGYETGEKLTLLIGGIKYEFEIAGFYECGLMCKTGYKCVISEDDYAMFSLILNGESEGKYTALWFDCDNDFSFDEFTKNCSDSSCENLDPYMWTWDRQNEKEDRLAFINMFLYLLAFFSAVTMLSALFMIMHRVSDDIEDQIQQIGVLEALGYRTREILFSYVGEYLICGGLGSVLGSLLATCVSPLMDKGVENMMGRTVSGSVEPIKLIFAAAIVTLLVIAIALIRAAKVRKYPPVVAFRKGIQTHHFGRNVLPLEKSKGSVNLALAAKSFIGDVKSSLGVMLCVIASGAAIFFCANVFDLFKDGSEAIVRFSGLEMTLDAELVNGVDPYYVRDRIAEMPEVKKAVLSYTNPITSSMPVRDSDYDAVPNVFDEYKDIENIKILRGRFPEHDNEVMICVNRCSFDGIDIGDSLVLKGNGIENKYIVTGVTTSMFNFGRGIYLTAEGYLRTDFNAHPVGVSIYLNDGIDEDEFKEKLYSVFGKSVRDSLNASYSGGTLEERIKAEADRKMAMLVSFYGVTNADYAVVSGDKVITGNSRGFVIKDITSVRGMIKQQTGVVATVSEVGSAVMMIVVAAVVAVILGLIVSGTVKRQRKSLGIMKGMGYSSKDLMLQITLKTMPVTVISVIIAAVLTKYIYCSFWLTMFGNAVTISIPVTVITGIALVAFCYAVTYFCAGKVKAISVTELMTE